MKVHQKCGIYDLMCRWWKLLGHIKAEI